MMETRPDASAPAAVSRCFVSLPDNVRKSSGIPKQSLQPDKSIRVLQETVFTKTETCLSR